MTQKLPIDSLTKIVEALMPHSSEDRGRLVRSAMAFLGETAFLGEGFQSLAHGTPDSAGNIGELPLRARTWMKQNSIESEQLQQIFHMSDSAVEVISTNLPGRNKKEQTYSAYILTGVGQLLLTGNASFDDKAARTLCEVSGCYDRANHAAHLKDRGNEFTGTKEKGWMLTAPGLKRGAELIKEMVRHGS